MTRKIRHQYDRWATLYDRVWRGYSRVTSRALLNAARLQPAEEVLDVGCGTGAFEAQVTAAHPHQSLVGVDLSEEMLAAAREKNRFAPRARFVQADAHDLPFDDAAFDVVVSASVLHYFTDPATALKEMARVVRPTGRVVLLDWCRDFLLTRLIEAVLHRVDPAHQSAFTLDELRALLRAVGFVPRQAESFRYWWWGLMVVEAHPRVAG